MESKLDGLGGRFISLDGAVQAVSMAISIAAKEVEGWLSVNQAMDEKHDDRARQQAEIEVLLKQGHAAQRLLDLLNRPANSRPGWYENASGFARFNDSVGSEGLEILHRWAKDSWYSAPMPPSRWGFPARVPGQTSMPRAMELGFDVGELRRFLDEGGVPHRLELLGGGASQRSSAGQKGIRKTGEAETPERPKFRGPLAEVLALAWEGARDKGDAHSVYAELCKLASQEKPPIPLVGFAGSDGVEWSDDTAEGGISFFTLKDMRSRLRPKRS